MSATPAVRLSLTTPLIVAAFGPRPALCVSCQASERVSGSFLCASCRANLMHGGDAFPAKREGE